MPVTEEHFRHVCEVFEAAIDAPGSGNTVYMVEYNSIDTELLEVVHEKAGTYVLISKRFFSYDYDLRR